MSWDVIAALAELLAAGGVIVSLGYLARQIRMSARASQQAAVEDLLSGARILLGQIASDPAVSRVWRLGMLADESLTADELGQFGALLTQMTYDWMRLYHLSQEGVVEPWVVHSNRATRRDIVSAPGYQRWYEQRKHWLTDEFRTTLEGEMTLGNSFRPLAVDQQGALS